MTYKIKPTSTKHRKNASGDYIIVMNKNVKSTEKIGKYVVVKYLFSNDKNNFEEYRTMTIFGKVIVDDSLGDGEIAIDQSIRNAMGIPVGDLENIEVKVAPLKRPFWQVMFDKMYYGNYHFARVHKPDVVDIEKSFCRMTGDSIQVMGALEGKTIIIEKTTSNLKKNINQLLEKVACGSFDGDLSVISEYCTQLETIKLNKQLERIFEVLLPNKESENSYKAVELVLSLKKCDENLRKIFLNNVFELWDWELMTTYKKISLKVPVYTLKEESIKRIDLIKNNQEEISFYTRYPNSELIFGVSPDISGIYLDKYYRDLLQCGILDSVKVKKNRFTIIFNEIMEYGVMFVMSAVATIMAFNGKDNQESLIALLFSIIITMFLIRIRTK